MGGPADFEKWLVFLRETHHFSERGVILGLGWGWGPGAEARGPPPWAEATSLEWGMLASVSHGMFFSGSPIQDPPSPRSPARPNLRPSRGQGGCPSWMGLPAGLEKRLVFLRETHHFSERVVLLGLCWGWGPGAEAGGPPLG